MNLYLQIGAAILFTIALYVCALGSMRRRSSKHLIWYGLASALLVISIYVAYMFGYESVVYAKDEAIRRAFQNAFVLLAALAPIVEYGRIQRGTRRGARAGWLAARTAVSTRLRYHSVDLSGYHPDERDKVVELAASKIHCQGRHVIEMVRTGNSADH